ncbi:MAG: endonuclease [Candidatus Marinimicrobia bacterium]|nr:endonuclease [Candidatus Neomarinimicrobiota bacterium]
MKKILLLFLIISTAIAAIPDGYYDNASGLSGTALRSALHNIVDGHTALSYTPGVWDAFLTTDLKANGKIWDIYSSYEYTWGTDQAGNYSAEGDVYNREHTWPQSLFNEASPMKTDLFHIYPSDGYVNGWRSNYPYGETNSPTRTSTNGSKLGSARSGLGYSGTVFEPIDEYKGDLARSYFYMATRYYNEDGNWDNWAMADGVELKQWAVEMLLEWHEMDTVSSKELNRNEAIYALQHNRNPFIDHPEYIYYIWTDSIPSAMVGIPEDFKVGDAYPNPFNPRCTLPLELDRDSQIKISLFDILGNERNVLFEGMMQSGHHYIDIDGSDLSTGMYLIRVQDNNGSVLRKVLLIK